MALTSTATFDVADATPLVVTVAAIVEAPLGFGTGGKGRLTHPSLGIYDYLTPPTETVNIDGDVCWGPRWAHTETVGGGADVLWPGYIRDVIVTERWKEGDVGASINHLRALWQFFINPPDPTADQFVIWTPNYATNNNYKVAMVSIIAGGEEYTLDRRLASWGYAPQPVELKLRVIDYEE